MSVQDVNQRIAARDDLELIPVIDLDDGLQRVAVLQLSNLAAQWWRWRRWSGCRRRLSRRGSAASTTCALAARGHRLAAAALSLFHIVRPGVLHGSARREEARTTAFLVQHSGVAIGKVDVRLVAAEHPLADGAGELAAAVLHTAVRGVHPELELEFEVVRLAAAIDQEGVLTEGFVGRGLSDD
jgi:hypothetical protein